MKSIREDMIRSYWNSEGYSIDAAEEFKLQSEGPNEGRVIRTYLN